MQRYALDLDKQVIKAQLALKKKDYYCIECNGIVRLRSGPHVQRHFYHLEPTPFCRQHQKSAAHLHLQSYFFNRLPLGDCQLEYAFPEIQRIADVAWISQKTIFEIQCSPISAHELLSRNRDYQSLGWQVIWILHDHRYNQTRLSSSEIALRSSPHYYANIDHYGNGIIYDQFDMCENATRLKRLPPLPIEIGQKRIVENIAASPKTIELLKQRLETWKVSFGGDLIDKFLNDSDSQYLLQAISIEKKLRPPPKKFVWSNIPRLLWQKGLANPYQIFFRYMLEKICR